MILIINIAKMFLFLAQLSLFLVICALACMKNAIMFPQCKKQGLEEKKQTNVFTCPHQATSRTAKNTCRKAT